MCALRNGKNYEGNGLSDISETLVNILYEIYKRIFVILRFRNFLPSEKLRRSYQTSHANDLKMDPTNTKLKVVIF